MSPTKPPILTQQITADFQHSQRSMETTEQSMSMVQNGAKPTKSLKSSFKEYIKKLTNVQNSKKLEIPPTKEKCCKINRAVKLIDYQVKHDENNGNLHKTLETQD